MGDDIKLKIFILTISDRVAQGIYADESGGKIKEFLLQHFAQHIVNIEQAALADEQLQIEQMLRQLIAQKYDFVFTTGGTGIGPRDVTPEAVKNIVQHEISGIMEAIRVKYGRTNPNAWLSRGIAGVADCTIIFTLPGSVKAVQEYLREIAKILLHAHSMLRGGSHHR